ncbi:hypothetical protein KKB10_04320 [Patescibacteria group bacterium]|nr:hypothetical protein [Patescibacteria group bacterium]MBU1074678.1 hypothetical protein [Patescibacteria group bacterium]MBU1951474.1 hypothetical protein [Patescibacteria group bacterium]
MAQEASPKSRLKKQNRQSNKSLIILIVTILTICLLGIGLGLIYSQLPESNPQKNQNYCEKAGGEWEQGQSSCLLSNRFTGEVCTDGGQCQSGVCFPPILTEEQQIALTKGEITGITGTCYPEELIEGCVKQVLKGTASMESLCYE